MNEREKKYMEIRGRLQRFIANNDQGHVAKMYIEDVKFLLEDHQGIIDELQRLLDVVANRAAEPVEPIK